jgi:uncharacterized protein
LIFVDTGPLVARYLPSDQHYRPATVAWSELSSRGERLATTNLVVAEFLTLLTRRSSPAFATERGRQLYGSTAIEVVRATEADETRALVLLESMGAVGVGFVDCVSFAVMRSRAIASAFTLDAHFAEAGFRVFPDLVD